MFKDFTFIDIFMYFVERGKQTYGRKGKWIAEYFLSLFKRI